MGRKTRAVVIGWRVVLALLVGVPVFFCGYVFFELSGWYAALLAAILGVLVIYTVVQNDRFSKEARADMAALELKWFQEDWSATWIRWTYSKRRFQERYGHALKASLDALIFEDIDAVLRGLADAVYSIPADKSVYDNARIAIEVAEGEMRARTSSLWHLFERRRELPIGASLPAVAPSSITPDPRLLQPLLTIISEMAGRDAAVFVGRLAGAYIKTCPVERYRQYVFRNPGRRASDLWPIFRTMNIEGDLLLRIHF